MNTEIIRRAVGQVVRVDRKKKKTGQPFWRYLIDFSGEREEKVWFSNFHKTIGEKVSVNDWVEIGWYQSGDFQNIDHLLIFHPNLEGYIWSSLEERDRKKNGKGNDAIKAVQDEGGRLTPDALLPLEVILELADALRENTAAICAAQGWSKLEAKRELEKMKGGLG